MNREERIQYIAELDAHYSDGVFRNDASLVALGAAIGLLSEYQWELVKETTDDFMRAYKS